SIVQPNTWCRNAERWKSQAFCPWTRNAAPETTKAALSISPHHWLCSFPRTSASSTAPASIRTSAQTPCASMWSVEVVKKTITGHMNRPSVNASPGHRYARHARRRQTSVPTTASASRQRPRIRKPVAKSQWTCSAGGYMSSLEVLQQPRQHEEIEQKPDCDHKQRRLDEQPPEALAVRVEQGHAVRLDDRPDDSGQRRQ